MIECPQCHKLMELCEKKDVYDWVCGKNIGVNIRWRLHCPHCNHYSIALIKYEATNIKMEWE